MSESYEVSHRGETFTVVDSPRPETQGDERAAFNRGMYEALTEISHLLGLAGWPDLVTDNIEGVRRLVEERDRLKKTLAAIRKELS